MRTRTFFLATTASLCLVFAGFVTTFAQTQSCFAPGNVVSTDNSDVTILPSSDIQNVYVGEPIYGDSSQQIAFSLKVRSLHPDLLGFTLPPGTWNVIFTDQNGVARYVQMSTLLGPATYTRGTVTNLLGIPIFHSEGAIRGTNNADGMVTMFVNKSDVGSPIVGSLLSIVGRTFLNTIGIGLVPTDDSPTANYQVVGNSGCAPFQAVGFGMNGDVPASHDYTRNGTNDFAVWRPSNDTWYTMDNVTYAYQAVFQGAGELGDIPVPGNYDNDNLGDFMVYRPSTGDWHLRSTETGEDSTVHFGASEDIPLSGDYDGDRIDDLAVWRPSTGAWYMLWSSDGSFHATQFGSNEDRPIAADFDGDRKTDVAVFRPSTGAWYYLNSGDGSLGAVQWGLGTDVVAPGDYDGDGKADPAVFRPQTGIWYILQSNNGALDAFQWGQSTDKVVPGDYNGNGRNDYAVWRPENGVWYIWYR